MFFPQCERQSFNIGLSDKRVGCHWITGTAANNGEYDRNTPIWLITGQYFAQKIDRKWYKLPTCKGNLLVPSGSNGDFDYTTRKSIFETKLTKKLDTLNVIITTVTQVCTYCVTGSKYHSPIILYTLFPFTGYNVTQFSSKYYYCYYIYPPPPQIMKLLVKANRTRLWQRVRRAYVVSHNKNLTHKCVECNVLMFYIKNKSSERREFLLRDSVIIVSVRPSYDWIPPT